MQAKIDRCGLTRVDRPHDPGEDIASLASDRRIGGGICCLWDIVGIAGNDIGNNHAGQRIRVRVDDLDPVDQVPSLRNIGN